MPPAEPRVPAARKNRKLKPSRISPLAQRVLGELVRDPDQTVTQIARATGCTHPAVTGIIRRPAVQEVMQEMMERHPSLKREALLQKLAEGLDASKKTYFADKGRVKTTKTDIDFPTRGFYLSLATKINGAQAPQKIELSGPNGAPLIPDSLARVLEAMPEDVLKTLVAKLSGSAE